MDTLYEIVLIVHNLLRWVVVVLGVIAVTRAFLGWQQRWSWRDQDGRLASAYTRSLDLQVLLGLLLYFILSPITTGALRDLGAAMGNPDLRFFVVEHFAGMLLASVLAHIGVARARRVEADAGKYRTLAIFLALSILAILAAIPWSRPLLRF